MKSLEILRKFLRRDSTADSLLPVAPCTTMRFVPLLPGHKKDTQQNLFTARVFLFFNPPVTIQI